MKDKDKDLRVPIKEQFPDVIDIMLFNKRANKKAKQKKYFKEKNKNK